MNQYSLVGWFEGNGKLDFTVKTSEPCAQQYHVDVQRGYQHIGLLEMGSNLRWIELEGSLISDDGSSRAFSKRFSCKNITEWTAGLFAPNQISSAMRMFDERLKLLALMNKLDDDLRIDITIERSSKDPTDAIKALETQLDCTLPDEIHDLASHRIEINNSLFLNADSLLPALRIMERDDGQPSNLLDNSPAIKRLYQRSVIVFRQIGDGVGYVLYDSLKRDCYWVHQESIFEPKRLCLHDGYAMSISQAIAVCIAATELYSLDEYVAYTETDTEVIVDDIHPAGSFTLNFSSEPSMAYNGFDTYRSFIGLQ